MTSEFLVTLCNSGTNRPKLLKLSVESGLSPVSIGDAPPSTGATGCVRWGKHFIVALQGTVATLLVLNERLEEERRVVVPELQDVHGLLVHNDHLLAVSSGSNQVFRLSQELALLDVVGANEGILIDRDHLNDLCLVDGRLIVCAFGPRRISGLRNGCVFDLISGDVLFDGLNEPHSPIFTGSELFVLDSGTGMMFRLDCRVGPIRVLSVGGYSRGLYANSQRILVGKSVPRLTGRRSPFQSHERLVATKGGRDENATPGIFVYERATGEERFFSTKDYAPEIYQICPLS